MTHKFKVGDKVRVREDLVLGECYGNQVFNLHMDRFKGRDVVIERVCGKPVYYEDIYYFEGWYWNDLMLEEVETNKENIEKKKEKVGIKPKYNIGDEVCFKALCLEGATCILCKGEKKINYTLSNGTTCEISCPECKGVGVLEKKHVEKTLVGKIVEIKINVSLSDVKIRYTISEKGRRTPYNRKEGDICLAKPSIPLIKIEELEMSLDDLKTGVNVSPSIDKVIKRMDYYNKNGKFKKKIKIDENDVITDGYITYLIAKLLGMKTIKVFKTIEYKEK